ncbi:MAG: PEP-CTERM sorting domain-containing protein [Nitrosomonadaceae bacterium]
MKIKLAILAAAVASVFSVSAQAAPIFSDNFDSYAADQLNWIAPGPSGWTVTGGGTVDIIGTGGAYDFLPGNGSYVDLDGSTNNSGLLTHTVSLLAGHTYSLSFDLAGSHRGSSETVDVKFGTTAASFTLASNDGFSLHTMNFTAISTGLYSFDYQNLGGDNVGALLDNVAVTSVPEPESYALFMAGLGVMGFIARRRKNGQS